MTAALRRGMGEAIFSEVHEEFQAHREAGQFRSVDGPKYSSGRSFTTPETIAAERANIAYVRDGQNAVTPIMAKIQAQEQANSRDFFPRAELTSLAYVIGEQDSAFVALLEERPENREKAAYLASRVLAGTCPEAQEWANRAAVARMKELLEAPGETLTRIKEHAQDALARLYRQRNLILHAGRTRAVALRSTLRGATPLVGAGLDRICHARFVDQLTPIALAGRARTALGTVQAGDAAKCTTLLGDS